MPPETKQEVEHRQVIYRALFDRPAAARRLAAITCRFVWNRMLEGQQQPLDDARLNGATPPTPGFFAPGREFTRLCRDTPRLQEKPFVPVRYALRYRAGAWKRFLEGKAGHPRFKRYGNASVTGPQDVRIRDGRLRVPKPGWPRLRRRGGNPYPDRVPNKAVLRRVGGKWMATVCYEIAAPVRTDNGRAIGIDMNTRQVAVGDGQQAHLLPAPGPNATRARATPAKPAAPRQPETRERGRHHRRRGPADKGDDAVGPGHDGEPRHTSRTCATCGYVDRCSRRARAHFKCVACGHADHADLNVARNIRRRGPALLHGEERSGLPSPATREMDRSRAA